ncbi:hypothetical protein GCM10027570_16070 [Streptomonospora sediminis]
MTVDSRLLAALALLAAAVLAVLAAAAGWWGLLWCAVPLGLSGLVVLLLRGPGTSHRPAPPPTAPARDAAESEQPAPAPSTAPWEPRRAHLAKAPLPSAHPEYDVLLSGVVWWRTDRGSDPGSGGRAKSLIVERAAELTRNDPPQDCKLTGHRLAAALGQAVRAEPDGIEVWAEEVRLELHDEDAARLERIRGFRKDEEVREHERAAERNFRQYLRSEMLADPGQAVLWWLARDPEAIHDTVGEIGTLSRLTAATGGTEIPPLYRDLANGTTEPEPEPPSPNPPEGPEPSGPGDETSGAAPPPGFPGTLFDPGTRVPAGSNGAGHGTVSGGDIGSGDGGGRHGGADDPRRAVHVMGGVLAGSGNAQGRDRVEVVAAMLAEAGRADLAGVMRDRGSAGAGPASAADPSGSADGSENSGTGAGAGHRAEHGDYGAADPGPEAEQPDPAAGAEDPRPAPRDGDRNQAPADDGAGAAGRWFGAAAWTSSADGTVSSPRDASADQANRASPSGPDDTGPTKPTDGANGSGQPGPGPQADPSGFRPLS